jgi:uncharacterized integral membrane protein
MKLSTPFVLVPALIVTAWLAIANRKSVVVSFDPFSQVNPAITLDVPIYIVFLAGALAGIVLGAFGAWFAQGRYRRDAREARRTLRTLEKDQKAGGSALPAVRR